MSEVESNYPNFGSILILIGGILAIVASAARIVFMLFVGRVLWPRIARPMVTQRLGESALTFARTVRSVYSLIIVGAIVTVALGIIAIYAYARVKRGKVQNGGLIAIIIGIIILVSTHWLAGILTLVGGILCYAPRKSERPA